MMKNALLVFGLLFAIGCGSSSGEDPVTSQVRTSVATGVDPAADPINVDALVNDVDPTAESAPID